MDEDDAHQICGVGEMTKKLGVIINQHQITFKSSCTKNRRCPYIIM
jgi:hypothetical protein